MNGPRRLLQNAVEAKLFFMVFADEDTLCEMTQDVDKAMTEVDSVDMCKIDFFKASTHSISNSIGQALIIPELEPEEQVADYHTSLEFIMKGVHDDA